MVLPHTGGSLGQAAVPACPRGCRVAVTSVPPLSSSWRGDTSPGPSPGCGAVSGPAWRTGSLLGREEGAEEEVVKVKRQNVLCPGEIRGDVPRGMNLGGQQDLCSDLGGLL